MSIRQWADIHHAAKLAREQGVCLNVYGVKVFPCDSLRAVGDSQHKTARKPEPSASAGTDQKSMVAADSDPPTKKQQRDQQRAAAHREELRVAPILARWKLLAHPFLSRVRWTIRDST